MIPAALLRLGVILLFALFLYGCGGGTAMQEEPDLAQTRLEAYDAIETSIQKLTAALVQGASQSAEVSIAFDAPQFERFRPPVEGDPSVKIDVQHGGGSLSLDSSEHTVEEPHRILYQQSPLVIVTPPPGSTYDYPYSHDSQEWTLFDYDPEGSEMAYVAISWNNHDVTDYLAAGYWIDTVGDIAEGPAETAHVGVFVEGSEFGPRHGLDRVATLPETGTATYIGHSAGMYTYYYGASAARFSRPDLIGARETTVWSGSAKLQVDFGRGKISGCIGCIVEGLPESAVIWESDGDLKFADGSQTVNSATYHNRDDVHFTRYYLQETDLVAPGGTMRGTLFIENDYDSFPFVGGDGGTSEGVWEARFSHRPNAIGRPDPRLPDDLRPRILGGTMVGTWTGSDGQELPGVEPTHGDFVGYFLTAPKSTARLNFPRPQEN